MWYYSSELPEVPSYCDKPCNNQVGSDVQYARVLIPMAALSLSPFQTGIWTHTSSLVKEFTVPLRRTRGGSRILGKGGGGGGVR